LKQNTQKFGTEHFTLENQKSQAKLQGLDNLTQATTVN